MRGDVGRRNKQIQQGIASMLDGRVSLLTDGNS